MKCAIDNTNGSGLQILLLKHIPANDTNLNNQNTYQITNENKNYKAVTQLGNFISTKNRFVKCVSLTLEEPNSNTHYEYADYALLVLKDYENQNNEENCSYNITLEFSQKNSVKFFSG